MFAPPGDDMLRGESAQLSGIRAALSSPNEALLTAALEPFLRDDDDDTSESATPLHQERNVTLSWQVEESEEDESGSCQGFLVITRQACLFCAAPTTTSTSSTGESSSATNDWYVPATSITLHALTAGDDQDSSSSPSSVYIQIENPQDDESSPTEWTVQCADASALFAALSALVSLHPIDPHQDTNELYGDDEDDNFEPEDMIWASDIRGEDDDGDDEDDGAATEQERQAMLDRLDQVLVVPPAYEISDDGEKEGTEGQFDDAEDDDEML